MKNKQLSSFGGMSVEQLTKDMIQICGMHTSLMDAVVAFSIASGISVTLSSEGVAFDAVFTQDQEEEEGN